MGVDPEPLRHVPLAEGPIGRVAHTGTLWVAESPPAREPEPSACIPLKSGGRVYGVVAIFQLLPHRPDCFTPADRAFFELLETQAGRALHFSFLDVTGAPSEPRSSLPPGSTPP
jgi:GAF domain-containing protein